MKTLVNFTFVLSVFCFFALVPFIRAEVQPYAVVCAFLGLIIFPFRKENRAFLLWIVVITISLIARFLVAINIDMVLTYIGFIVPIIIFMFMYGNMHLVRIRIFEILLFAWTLLSICQYWFNNFLDILGVTGMLKVFIGRYTSEALSSFNRGVVAFTPEPSYSAHVITLFICMTIYYYNRCRLSLFKLSFYFISFCILFITNRSGTLGMNIILLIGIYLASSMSIKKLVFSGILVALFALVIDPNFRSWLVVKEVGNQIMSQGFSYANVLGALTSLGSSREFSVSVAYTSAFSGNLFGYGLGSWSTEFINVMYEHNFDPSLVSRFGREGLWNLKPYSYVGVIAFDLGLLGVILFTLFLSSYLRSWRFLSVQGKTIVIFSLFMIYFHTLMSLPIYWLTLLIGLELKKC